LDGKLKSKFFFEISLFCINFMSKKLIIVT
jgi:hypothetical protein